MCTAHTPSQVKYVSRQNMSTLCYYYIRMQQLNERKTTVWIVTDWINHWRIEDRAILKQKH